MEGGGGEVLDEASSSGEARATTGTMPSHSALSIRHGGTIYRHPQRNLRCAQRRALKQRDYSFTMPGTERRRLQSG